MKTRTLKIINVVFFLLIAGLIGSFFMPTQRQEILPLFSMEGLNHTDLNEDVMILNVFASWCPPCEVEHPLLLELSKQYDIPIYGIAFKDKKENIEKFLARKGNPYRKIGMDYAGLLTKAVPETIILTKDRKIHWHVQGPLNETVIKEDVLPLIKSLRENAAQPPH